ncbi:hypothetical protein DSO57_1031536 [Entomophthora muscae]|uniref:Uncharacterized protein n=1 Tax=Entomophthora muscae TaxID=34485 RepID=A0ACC2TMK5_9FUNG|nr:hypothetical protein DSO57_1031536 [Entomophthora muscae]
MHSSCIKCFGDSRRKHSWLGARYERENATKQCRQQAVNLLGNHEIMNIMGIYDYVSPEDIQQFGNITDRIIAFSKDGWVGKYLRKLNVTAIVEDTVFCHGGIPVPWAKKGVEHMNTIAKDDLDTKTPQELWEAPIFGEHGPTWYRGYALDSEESICAVVDEALAHLSVKRMVVGHTVQEDGRIHTRCQGKVILIDVGISAVYGGHLAALELTPTSARAIYPTESVQLELPPGYLLATEDSDEL